MCVHVCVYVCVFAPRSTLQLLSSLFKTFTDGGRLSLKLQQLISNVKFNLQTSGRFSFSSLLFARLIHAILTFRSNCVFFFPNYTPTHDFPINCTKAKGFYVSLTKCGESVGHSGATMLGRDVLKRRSRRSRLTEPRLASFRTIKIIYLSNSVVATGFPVTNLHGIKDVKTRDGREEEL